MDFAGQLLLLVASILVAGAIIWDVTGGNGTTVNLQALQIQMILMQSGIGAFISACVLIAAGSITQQINGSGIGSASNRIDRASQ